MHLRSTRRRALGLAAGVAATLVILAACGDDNGGGTGAPASDAPASEVDATADFTLTYQGDSQDYSYVQSTIVPSTLDGTPQVPVSLHAADPDELLDEFVLSGRVEEGEQSTSDAVALGVGVHIGTSVVSINDTEGDCTVDVATLTEDAIEGTFRCDVDYAGEPATVDGAFAAS